MVNSNANALGILFPNSYDSLVPELVGERLMASIPFAGRYRMVDFILSSMVNCGIDNVSLIGSSGFRTRVGLNPQKRRSQHRSSLRREDREGIQRTCGGSVQHPGFPERSERAVCCHG